MTNLYLTADRIGTPTGGGAVTFHESEAFWTLGSCDVWDREELDSFKKYYINVGEPWQHDANAFAWLDEPMKGSEVYPYLTHVYAGTFSHTITRLKERQSKITYTAAAHDIEESRKEHESLGIAYDYPHLTDPELWKRYVAGYLATDVVICPSEHSATVMRSFGCKNVQIIPHGCTLPPESSLRPLPYSFRVGYLGAYGPDKGVKYLLEAWKKLDYKDATLVLGGRDSNSSWVRHLIQTYGGGRIEIGGWYENVADFYNTISCYVQPSVTEGFGIEVLEAMSYGRPVICSTGAGAVDCVPFNPHGLGVYKFEPRNVEQLMNNIHDLKQWDQESNDRIINPGYRGRAAEYTWDKVRQQYINLWQGLL